MIKNETIKRIEKALDEAAKTMNANGLSVFEMKCSYNLMVELFKCAKELEEQNQILNNALDFAVKTLHQKHSHIEIEWLFEKARKRIFDISNDFKTAWLLSEDKTKNFFIEQATKKVKPDL